MLIATDGEALAARTCRRKFATHIRRTPHAARPATHHAVLKNRNREAERQIVIQALESQRVARHQDGERAGTLRSRQSFLKIMRRLGVQRDTKGSES